MATAPETPQPQAEQKMANGNGNGKVRLVEKIIDASTKPGGAVVILMVGMTALCTVAYLLWLKPMTEQNMNQRTDEATQRKEMMDIFLERQKSDMEVQRTYLEMQRLLVANQSDLTDANTRLTNAFDGIDMSLKNLDTTMSDQAEALQEWNKVRQEQLEAIRQNQILIELGSKISQEVSESMQAAQELMSGVPEERIKQTKLLEEIRDKLPAN